MNGLRRALRTVSRLAESVERSGPWSFVALSLLYWAFTVTLASRKLMWNDELYTYHMARLPTMSDVWGALQSGGEQLPPFFYVITRLAFDLFGTSAPAMRVPEMIGFWVMSAGLFIVVGRRTSKLAALCAAALPLVTTSYYYSIEGRPYALVLGFAAMSLVAWQAITEGRRRVFWLPALASSLGAAVSSHYYGLLVILPLAFGEAVLSVSRRRVDLPVWAAFAASVVPLVWYLPLLRAAAAYSGTFWSPPVWVNLPDSYSKLFAPAALPAVAILVLAGIYALVKSEAQGGEAAATRSLPAHEVAAACGFALLPVVCYGAARVVTGAFVDRYAIAAVIGFGLLGGHAVALTFGRDPAMRLVVALCLTGSFALDQTREILKPTVTSTVSRNPIDRPVEWLHVLAEQSLPVVVADPHNFAVLSHYAPPDVSARLFYVADPALAQKQLGHNSIERGMVDLLGPWFGMNVVPFTPFLSQHARFLVYGRFNGLMDWLLPELRARGMRTELLNQWQDTLLLLAYREGPAVESPGSGDRVRTPVARTP